MEEMGGGKLIQNVDRGGDENKERRERKEHRSRDRPTD